jgi:chromosome segregation ATPase
VKIYFSRPHLPPTRIHSSKQRISRIHELERELSQAYRRLDSAESNLEERGGRLEELEERLRREAVGSKMTLLDLVQQIQRMDGVLGQIGTSGCVTGWDWVKVGHTKKI